MRCFSAETHGRDVRRCSVFVFWGHVAERETSLSSSLVSVLSQECWGNEPSHVLACDESPLRLPGETCGDWFHIRGPPHDNVCASVSDGLPSWCQAFEAALGLQPPPEKMVGVDLRGLYNYPLRIWLEP